MATYISPGVYIQEQDFSDYVASLGTTVLGLVGTASMGPLDTPTLITNTQQFITTFGVPNVNQYGAYAALNYLRNGTQLWYIRVAKQYVLDAAILASSTTAGAFSLTLSESNPFAVGDYLRISEPGLRTTQNVRVSAIAELVVTLDPTTSPLLEAYTVAADIDQCSIALNPNPANAAASAEMMAYGRTGAGSGAALLPMVKFTARNPGTWANFGSSSGIEIQIQDGGQFSNVNPITGLPYTSGSVALQGVLTGTPSVDTRAQLNALSSADGVTVGQQRGVNRDSVVTGVAATVLASTTITATVTSTTGLIVGDMISITGSVGGVNDGSFTILTITDSTHLTYTNAAGVTQASETAIMEKTNGAHLATVFKCVTVSGTGSTWSPVGVLTKKVVVLFQGQQVEIFDSMIGYDPTSPNYWNTVIGAPNGPVGGSQYIFAEYLGSATQGAQPMSTYNSTSFPYNPRLLMGNTVAVSLTNSGSASVSSYAQAAGADGSDPNASAYIGVVNGTVTTGLQNFTRAQQYQINILAIPAVSDPAVIEAMIALLETRADCLGIVDPPFGLSVQEVVDWHNGTGTYSGQAAFVTNKAALYWPWVQQIDPYSSTQVWMPPSAVVPAVIVNSDQVSEVWYAPAGINRGVIQNALALEYAITQGDADYMYGPGNGNAINPIMAFPSSGIVVYGQRTLQRVASALDRVNVRRLIFFIEQSLVVALRSLVFEQNDPILWGRALALVNPFLTSIQGLQGLDWFQVVCDATTNTPTMLNNNEMGLRAYLIPSKTAEKVILSVALLASGTNTAEFIAQDSGANLNS